jgi:hypothetical protein
VRWAGLAVVAMLAGCPKPVAAPVLDGTWPAAAGTYETVTASYTRDASIERDYQLVAKAHATLLAPPWRAAWIRSRTERGKLGAEGRAELEAAQHQADESAWEIEIVLSTWDRDENDLDRGEKSIWRVVMIDPDGHEVAPIEIVRDRRPDDTVRTEFPAYDSFSRAYLVRFPKTAKLLGPGVTKVGLRLSSARGGMEMYWTAPAGPP